jgi:3-deoxy-alpha-D-manno-octulosonate 8-oxidase
MTQVARNLPIVPRVVFGRHSLAGLRTILETHLGRETLSAVYIIDPALRDQSLESLLRPSNRDSVIWADLSTEPTTQYIDELVAAIRLNRSSYPTNAVIGIGGGSTMDIAKAISLLLTNRGRAADYQGWDLVQVPGVFHVGVPSLAGSGAEVSRTAVLIGPDKKLGINSDYTPFDQIILDPTLSETAPLQQVFYTGMDCYVHSAEALHGTFKNAFSTAYAEKARDLCEEVFLTAPADSAEKMAMASYFGGLSIGYSQVGICHALSYGLSFGLGTRHGLANCIIFRKLEPYFPREVAKFHEMAEKRGISFQADVCHGVPEQLFNKMVAVAMGMAPLWQNTFGPDWQTIVTPTFIHDFYRRL